MTPEIIPAVCCECGLIQCRPGEAVCIECDPTADGTVVAAMRAYDASGDWDMQALDAGWEEFPHDE